MHSMVNRIDVVALLDNATITRRHISLMIWSFLIMLLDGFDLQAIGYVVPTLVKEWHMERAVFGAALSAGLLGMMIGTTQGGALGDRLGRKRTVLAGVAWFGLCTLLTAWVGGLSGLVALRFLAGVGLGCAVPNVVALTSEFAPKRLRATMVTVMFLGYTMGAALGGAAAAMLIPRLGWGSVFLLGGAAPLLVALICLFDLPESIRFQLMRRGQSAAVRLQLQRWFPAAGIDAGTELLFDEPKLAGYALAHLFRENRAPFTILLWICFIANLITLHFIANWLPTVIESTGVPLRHAVFVTSLFSVGGTFGGIFINRLLDRGSLAPLVGFFAMAALMIAAIGMVNGSETMLEVIVFGAGLFVIGTQFGLNALAASSYPTFIRATGVGWALGVGRFGSILGPVAGGVLIALKLPIQHIFLWGATPMLIGCIASIRLLRLRRDAIRAGQELSMATSLH